MLPGLAESILRGKQGTQSDGLEICKQAVALLVGDIRAEVQQAVAALRSEASSVATTGANVDVRANQPQMSKKLLGVAETLQSAEQDALGKLRELMKSTNWELGQRLDKQMQVNAKLGDHMHNSWEQILEVVKRLEVKMQQLEETVQNSSESLTKDVSSVSTALQGVASQIGQNTGDLHDLGNTHYRDLKTIGQQITETNNEIYERMKKSDASLGSSLQRLDDLANSSTAKLTKVVESQDSLATAASHIAQDLHRLQQQDDKHYVDLGLSLETQLSVHGSRISDLQASTSRIFEPVQADVLRIRRQVNSDSRAMLAEIGRIQKALNVEYVTLQDSTRKGAFKDEIESLATDNLDMDAKRSRDYFTQTDLASTKESFMMTDPVQFESDGKKKKKKPDEKKKDDLKAKMKKSAFAGADKLLQQATMAAMQKPYNVFDYYWEEGFAQRLAKSNHFDSITLLMVFVNALWIAVDTDLNKASNLLRADAIFLIMENVFTIFFSFELTVRFLAFQDKMRCLKDYWFLFDSCLVTIAILETWVIPVATLSLDGEGGGTGMNVARLIRLVRLLRLTRLGRLLRAAPELVIIMKGLAFASRSVLVFFALWVIVAYVFAILFRSLTDETDVGTSYFATVPESLNLLLLHGIFGSNANLVIGITAGNPALWPIIVFFMTLVSVTILYMLVGVLVDVIGAVATAEKEKLGVSHIVTQLRDQLETLGLTDSMEITQHEFQNLIIEPGIIRVIQEAGVDVAVLADMLDLVFEDVAAKGRGLMNFTDLVNVVLNMRGTNPATVKDCKEQIRVTKTLMRQQMDELMEELNEQFKSLRSEIQAIDMDFDEEDA
eukprot:CAMPEP_0197627108 /NCGR_PEP_ID=MMETSP1338-20131121/5804_1 /TAXON_ID=43686 ORGANISM="Pelagodinium beii, Strain RCC1491" /NCGR_SAMPLE_ID=MMETSP1338 /ASSEMBLY_ACC=CAM_ASM_000754 /LENGTH=835 /DNA_ID=CAMNT_0043197731 /DNA_START=57 /DNA_END=2564 /DNA_ORIENTATION=+